MSPTDVGFLTIPLPEPVTIWMVDRSPLDCCEREERRPQRQQQQQKREGKGREERGAWTIPQGQSDVQSFVFSGEISGPVQLPVDRQSNWRPGRNRCSHTVNMLLVGCLFTKSRGADFPFFGNKDRDSKESRLSTCRPVSGKKCC